MDEISVSLIMPVYNTDKILLSKTIASVKRQTSSMWNLWLIDDGSCEEIANYCDSFATDPRIKVVHQANSGVSNARNNGTQHARDSYVMYIDADDVLTDFALENALSLAKKTKADIIYGGVYRIQNQDEIIQCANLCDNSERINLYSSDDLRRRLLGGDVKGLKTIQGSGYIGRGPWSKLIKTDIAKSTPFPIGLAIGEDLVWNLRLLERSKNLIVANSIWYGYVTYSDSAISKYYGNRAEMVAKWIKLVEKENAEFCNKNKDIMGNLLASELYCIVQYDLIAPENFLSIKEKNKMIKKLLNQSPWKNLKRKEYRDTLSFMQLLFLFLCNISFGIIFVKAYVRIKRFFHK